MKIGWVIISAVLGFIIAKPLTRKKFIQDKSDSDIAAERLMQSRNQTMRLRELSTLNNRLDGTNKETESLEKSVKRLKTILDKLDHYVSTDQNAQSESLLTRFSKHLRHLLHEGASPTIKLHENLEYMEGALALMSAMNRHSWAFEIEDDQVAHIDVNRHVQTISLSAWIFDELWESVINDDIRTTVIIKLISDTYNLRAVLYFNKREVEISIKLLA